MLHAEDYVDNGIPIVTTEHFKSGFLPDEKAGLPQVSESDRARLEQYSAIEGDILFSRVGSVDVNAQVTAAQSGWLFSGRVLRARPAASVIRPNYLHYELSTDDVKRSIINRAVGGTMASINTEILEDTEIIFPRSAREQSEIGGFLGNLDHLITLHQRKRCNGPFTHPLVWEQRKLGELYSLVSEKNDLTFGRESIISVANMYFNANVNVADEQYLRTYNVMRLGDIAFEGHSNKEFSHGRFVENYIGDGIVSHIFTVLRPRVPFDVNYWRYAINNEKLMRLSLIRSTKASTMMHDLVPSDFLREAIPTPTLAEQKEIGAFLVGLDHLITLHQRKHDKLVQLKKSMLDKMFPKPGETEPEIRFAGFTDPWEQRKLGEFSKKITTKNADGAFSETFTNSAEQGVISQLDYFDHDITNDANISGYYVVQPDNFVYNPRISVTAPCGPINRNRLNRAGVMSPLYTVFSVDESVDKTYLEHYFKTSRWHDFMFLEGNSGARSDRFSISDATFFEMPIWCPKIPEQRAIAKQLETMDSLITLHQ